MGQKMATEACKNAGHGLADLAGADHACRLAMQVEAEQAFQGEIALAHAHVSAMELAIEREDQRHRMLRDRLRRVARHASDLEAQLARGHQIHIVESGAAQRDQADALVRQAGQRRPVELIIDEGADHLDVPGERCRLHGQPGLEIAQLMTPGIGRIQKLAIVALGVEHRDPHQTLRSMWRQHPRLPAPAGASRSRDRPWLGCPASSA